LKQAFVRDLDDVLRVLMGHRRPAAAHCLREHREPHARAHASRAHDLAVRTALGATRAPSRASCSSKAWRSARGRRAGLGAGRRGRFQRCSALRLAIYCGAADLDRPTVLAFTLSISLGSGAFFGVIPALKYAAPQVAAALAGAARSVGAARERQRATDGLVVAQVANRARAARGLRPYDSDVRVAAGRPTPGSRTRSTCSPSTSGFRRRLRRASTA